MKLTVPVGVALPGVAGATVAVKLTLCPAVMLAMPMPSGWSSMPPPPAGIGATVRPAPISRNGASRRTRTTSWHSPSHGPATGPPVPTGCRAMRKSNPPSDWPGVTAAPADCVTHWIAAI